MKEKVTVTMPMTAPTAMTLANPLSPTLAKALEMPLLGLSFV